jgi:hypothetical protein
LEDGTAAHSDGQLCVCASSLHATILSSIGQPRCLLFFLFVPQPLWTFQKQQGTNSAAREMHLLNKSITEIVYSPFFVVQHMSFEKHNRWIQHQRFVEPWERSIQILNQHGADQTDISHIIVVVQNFKSDQSQLRPDHLSV